MKNKEIEELLNELKDEDNYIEEYGFRYKRIALDDWWLLLSYIEQLEKENKQLKKQKDDGIDWIKNNYCYVGKKMSLKPFSDLKDLLRMLGEIDVEN